MSSHRGLFTIGLTVAASVIAVVACGPNGNNAVVIHQNDGSKVTAASACVSKLSHFKARVDDKVTINGKAPTVSMCEATDVDPSGYAKPNGDASKPTARPAYKVKTESVRFSVGSTEKQLAISMKIGLLFPNGTPKETSDAAVAKIKSFCLPPLQDSWAASQSVVDLQVDLEAVGDTFNGDQTVELVAADEKLDLASRPIFVLGLRPDRGQLVPNPLLTADCLKSTDCRLSFPASVNARFCSSFGLLVGEFLGLQSQESQTETCKATAAPASADAPLTDGFMKAEGLQDDPAQFWKRARFSKADLKTILGPACDGKPAGASSAKGN